MRPGLLLLALLLCAPIHACCVFDQDHLEDEALPWPGVIARLAGRIERNPATWHEAVYEHKLHLSVPGSELPDALEVLNALDQLDRQPEAIGLLLPLIKEAANDEERDLLREQLIRAYIHLWWRGGTADLSPELCLNAASEHLEGLTSAPYWQRFLAWARRETPVDPSTLMPDMLDLRLAGNKLAIAGNTQLADMGIPAAADFLLGLLYAHPVWENFDTFHALSLAWAADGRQALAHCARVRAWHEHRTGNISRLPGANQIGNIEPLTIVREFRGGASLEKLPLDPAYRKDIEAFMQAQIAYSALWRAARGEYAASVAVDIALEDQRELWAGFIAPDADFPALPTPVIPEAAQATAESTTKEQPASDSPRWMPWLLIGGLLLLLTGGFFVHRIATRKEAPPTS